MRTNINLQIYIKRLALVSSAVLMLGCSLRRLVDVDQSTNGSALDYATANSVQGALGIYYGAVNMVANSVVRYSIEAALMSDEFTGLATTSVSIAQSDVRIGMSKDGGQVFSYLSETRIQTLAAIGALQAYANHVSRASIGESYALLGITEVLLAESMCSGIPLASMIYGEPVQQSRGFSTEEVLNHAITLFDSALVYGGDSVPVATLARVGKGRALLNLGKFADAADAVASVPVSAAYLVYNSGNEGSSRDYVRDAAQWQIVNGEGGNGLTWIAPTPAQQDPRVRVTTRVVGGVTQFTIPVRQAKYPTGPIYQRLADGIEARLIIAESQLQPAASPRGRWLETLNDLRATVGLPDTTDPGTEAGRVDLLFRERAFWLYLTGHRHGDLRRLIRQYGRQLHTTFPSGPYAYPKSSISAYRDTVAISPPVSEGDRNPLYHGCTNYNP